MGKTHGRGRGAIALGIALAGMLLAWCPCAFALDPSLDVNQYAHTAWKVREGFTKGQIYSIAQTPDGYLWLGTEFGLLRFDGVRAAPWQPPTGHHLPSGYIRSLRGMRERAEVGCQRRARVGEEQGVGPGRAPACWPTTPSPTRGSAPTLSAA